MWTVYKHTMPDGKCYIGITKFLPEERWGQNGENYLNQYKMKHAILRFGWDNIQHEVLEENIKTEKEARQRETAYIEIFDSMINGYNSKLSNKTEYDKIPKQTYYDDFPVLQLDYHTGEIIQRFNSIREASEELRCCPTNIKDVCLKKQLTCKNSSWCFEEEYSEWVKPYKKEPRGCICVETQEIFPTITSCASYFNTTPIAILNCCKGKTITHHGKHFVFLDEYSENWKPRAKKPLPKSAEMKGGRSIPVYCEETNTIYPSATACAEAIPGITRVAVYHCCNGRSEKIFKKNEDGTKTPYHVRWAEENLDN